MCGIWWGVFLLNRVDQGSNSITGVRTGCYYFATCHSQICATFQSIISGRVLEKENLTKNLLAKLINAKAGYLMHAHLLLCKDSCPSHLPICTRLFRFQKIYAIPWSTDAL